MDVNFELYKIFYHTAKSGSFSSAAQKLYISQSAVSQAIKNLEEKMGAQLFLRKPRNVKLTDEGELLFKHIEQAYNFIKAGESKIFEMQI
jgi:DNA-binding transcriptional LysR family regulator